jgi:predicted RNA methylase
LARGPGRAQAAALSLSRDAGGPQAALSLLALRLAEPAGFLPNGSCAALARLPIGELPKAVAALARALRAQTCGALPPWPLRLSPTAAAARRAAELFAAAAPAPEELCFTFEALHSAALGSTGRRRVGLYYTPPGVAEQVVALALAHGSIPRRALPAVTDPCAGAGIFLAAAARALAARGSRAEAALCCSGADLDPAALRVARASLALCAGPAAAPRAIAALQLARRDSLRTRGEEADLLVSNPPYGHLDDPRERAFLARALPALRGGEIDRYAAFLLRSLELVREGGTAALLVPDTWMTNARAGGLRTAVLGKAEIAAVADLGKPFAAAKDTRVQAVVLVRRRGGLSRPRTTFAARAEGGRLVALEPLPEARLRESAAAGWQPYRSRGESALCAALEAASVPLREVCQVGYGLRTGNNPLHVERAPARPGEIALCGGEDVVPFALRPREKRLAHPTPALLALAGRQLGRERIAVQRIRTNSALPWARWLEAAKVPADVVCLDSLSTLSCPSDDLLWALLALLHSVALNRYHRLRTTDVNVKPSSLRELPVPRALLDPSAAAKLARLSRERAAQALPQLGPGRRRAAALPDAAPALERLIDRAVYRLYGLPEGLVEESERGFWGPRFFAEHARLGAAEAGDRDPAASAAPPPLSDPPGKVAAFGRSP